MPENNNDSIQSGAAIRMLNLNEAFRHAYANHIAELLSVDTGWWSREWYIKPKDSLEYEYVETDLP